MSKDSKKSAKDNPKKDKNKKEQKAKKSKNAKQGKKSDSAGKGRAGAIAGAIGSAAIASALLYGGKGKGRKNDIKPDDCDPASEDCAEIVKEGPDATD